MDGSEKPGRGTAPAAGAAPPATDDRFDEILTRLRGVVEKLEGGNLALEDSLKFFEEGIDLCRRGASILDSAERKVEVLLSGSSSPSGAPRTAPFGPPAGDGE